MNVDRALTHKLGRGASITLPPGPEEQDRPGEGETQPQVLAESHWDFLKLLTTVAFSIVC